MSKHTPGPWMLESDARSGGTERIVVTSDGGASISWTPERAYGVASEEEKDANARLIAAAPELLKELRYALESADHAEGCIWFDNFPPKAHGQSGYRCDCWRASAHAAIAKAEGKS